MNNDKFIPLSVPNLKGRELEYVTHAVETEWVSTAGPYVSEFEKKVADYVKTPGAVSCQNGTSGLHVSLLLCGVTCDDMVIVPTLTFIAAVNPVKYIGAEPLFMDCDESLCMDPVKLEKFYREECETRNGKLYHKESNRRVPAIVVVHVFGNMADMEAILELCERYHVKVVEDATEALGTKYVRGKYTGKYAGTIGTVGVYSFNGNKIVTTGGGGIIVSMDIGLLERARHLTTQAKSDEANFLHDEIGYNYRLTNIQAAIGIAQLDQLEGFIQIKENNYIRYREALKSVQGLFLMGFRSDIRTNYWFYSLYLDAPYPRNQAELITWLREHKIQSRPIWGLIHEQIPYKNSFTYKIERASIYWRHVVNLPCSTNLTSEDIDNIVNKIKS